MEMERINDNTIRVMVENDDLKNRGTSVRDLLSDRSKIETFFYNILAELDTDQDFVDNEKVSFQVLPNQNGLELFISRLDDDDALGAFLSTLGQDEESVSEKAADDMAPIDDLSLEKKQALQERDRESTVLPSSSVTGRIEVVELSDFEGLLSLVALLNEFGGRSSVYLYQGRYYLSLDARYLEMTSNEMNALMATLVEYSRFSKLSDSFLAEHGEVLFEGNGIHSLNRIFTQY
ncbi:Negative regulator MecA of genetic competence [Fructobacillus fructosus]|nr:Negative regulator MecA of genetic competence [Fructobacillus fructosus]